MKKLIWLIITFTFLFCLTTNAGTKNEYEPLDNVCGYKWGTEYQKIIDDLEANNLSEGVDYWLNEKTEKDKTKTNVIQLDGEMDGFESGLDLTFENNKLVNGLFMFIDMLSDDDYKKLIEDCMMLYGDPTVIIPDDSNMALIDLYIFADEENNMLFVYETGADYYSNDCNYHSYGMIDAIYNIDTEEMVKGLKSK